MGNELKIKIYGEAGQGIKTLSKILGKYLINKDFKYVTINVNYDSAVRGGKIDSDIILSNQKIDSPIIEKANLLLILKETENIIPADKVIYDQKVNCKIVNSVCVNSEITVKNYGSRILNMFYLGVLLKYLQIELNEKLFSLIPQKEENQSAILAGYDSID